MKEWERQKLTDRLYQKHIDRLYQKHIDRLKLINNGYQSKKEKLDKQWFKERSDSFIHYRQQVKAVGLK